MHDEAVAALEEADEIAFQVVRARLTNDLREAVRLMGRQQARYLVSTYYRRQEDRVREAARSRELEEAEEPTHIIDWLGGLDGTMERTIRAALGAYAERFDVGRWSLEQRGVGPIIAAGLLAHVDIGRAKTVSALWRFAGLDPSVRWIGRQGAKKAIESLGLQDKNAGAKVSNKDVARAAALLNRQVETIRRDATVGEKITVGSLTKAMARPPWNSDLKKLCWHIGQCISRSKNRPDSFYGPILEARWQREKARNEAGEFAETAAQELKAKRYSRDKSAYKTMTAGRLPDGRINARATRWITKLFLSHWHTVAWETMTGTPARAPFVIASPDHPGHEAQIDPPGYTPLRDR
jgi:hypothetical protein